MPEKGIFRWFRLRRKIKKYIKTENSAVQLIVQEFNPQEPGYNEWFRSYIIPDITIVTSVTNGRMQVEHSLEEVANEMISLANFSRMAMINRDDIDGRFASFLTNPNITTYGSDPVAEYNSSAQVLGSRRHCAGLVVIENIVEFQFFDVIGQRLKTAVDRKSVV